MDQHSENLANPKDAPSSTASAVGPTVPKRSFATRLFGYDIFLSFALGPPPRGTHGYASDLARRLRERDFTVFFSEDEAPPGEQLDNTLRSALHDSQTLVVVANRATLQEPRWVRKEVEEFRRRHPARPVITINLGGALQDPSLVEQAQEWLNFQDKIWLDETEQAVETGIASEVLVERLATAPRRVKSNIVWRWVVRGVVIVLAALTIGLGVATCKANTNAERALAELKRAVSLRLVAEVPGILDGKRVGGDLTALRAALAAFRIEPHGETYAILQQALITGALWIKAWDLPSEVTALAASSDGLRLVSGAADGSLQLWDAKSGQPIGPRMIGHRSRVNSVAFSSRDQFIASGSGDESINSDNSVRTWNGHTGQPLFQSAEQHPAGVRSVTFSHDSKQVASSCKHTLRLWDVSNMQRITGVLEKNTDNSLRIWEHDKGEREIDLEGFDTYGGSVAFSPNGNYLVYGGAHGVNFWNLRQAARTSVPIPGGATGLVFSFDGASLAVTGMTMSLFDLRSGKPVRKILDGETKFVRAVTFSPDGKRIAASFGESAIGAESWVQQWDVASGQPVGRKLRGQEGPIRAIVFTSSGTQIVTGGDKTIRLWDADGKTPPATVTIKLSLYTTSALAFSPYSQQVASGGTLDGTLLLLDAKSGAPVGQPIETGSVNGLAFLPGDRIVTGGDAKTVRLWNLRGAGTNVESGTGHTGPVTAIAASRDGEWIVSGSSEGEILYLRSDQEIRLWSGVTGKQSDVAFTKPKSSVNGLAFTPDGHRVIAATKSHGLQAWDARTGQQLDIPFEKIDGELSSVAVHPDGRFVVAGVGGNVGVYDNSVRVWNLPSGKLASTLTGHTGPVTSVAYSPDGDFIATGSLDSTVRFWDARRGKQVGAPVSMDSAVRAVAFSPDRMRMAVKTKDTLHIMPAPPAWPDLVCSKLTRNMSRKQWREWVSPEIEYDEKKYVQCPGLPIPPDEPDNFKEKP